VNSRISENEFDVNMIEISVNNLVFLKNLR